MPIPICSWAMAMAVASSVSGGLVRRGVDRPHAHPGGQTTTCCGGWWWGHEMRWLLQHCNSTRVNGRAVAKPLVAGDSRNFLAPARETGLAPGVGLPDT